MFRNDGYLSVSRYRGWFDLHNLPSHIQLEVLRDAKRRLYGRNVIPNTPEFKSETNTKIKNALFRSVELLSDEQLNAKISNQEARLEAKILSADALRHFLYFTDLFLLGPDGKVVSVSNDMLARKKTTWAGEWKGFYFLSLPNYIISVGNFLEIIDAIKVLKRQKDMLAKHAFDEKRFEDMLNLEHAARAILQYDQYFLAIRERSAPTVDELRTFFRLETFMSKTGGRQNAKGRPRKKEAALEAYDSCFPEGHDGVTWPQILAELKKKCGIIVGEDTLRTALRERESPEKAPK